MSSGCLRDLTVRAWLHRMNQIWEPDGILDEENRDIVPNDVLDASVVKFKHAMEGQWDHTEIPFIRITRPQVSTPARNTGD